MSPRLKANVIRLRIPGHPVGKGRHRTTKNGHTYTPKETKLAEATVRDAWSRASAQFLDGPLRLSVLCAMARPQNHYLVNGELSAAGARHPYPAKKPDGDNILKTVTDALNTIAYKDDAQIIDWTLSKRWVKRGEQEFTLIVLRPTGDADGAG